MIIGSALAGILPGAAFAEEAAVKKEKVKYNENFDNINNGELPDGWTLYSDNPEKVSAYVQDGALVFSSTNWNGNEWLLFDKVTDAARSTLTMECDITYQQNTSTGNLDKSCAGFAYMTSTGVDENGAIKVKGDHIGFFTDKEDTAVQRMHMAGDKNDGRTWYHEFDAEGIAAINDGDNKTVHFKVSFTTDQHGPIVYIDGTQVTWDRGTIYSGQYYNQGSVGLYVSNSNVVIDNLKIECMATIPKIKTYKAVFKTPKGKYADAEQAKADVMVSECDYFGKFERDVTEEAQIDASEDLDGNITIDVVYGEFTKTLTTKVADFDLISVSEAEAVPNGLKLKVSNNSKKAASAVMIACPMKGNVPFGKGIYFKTVTLEAKEENKETEFTFEYDGDNIPDSYNIYFVESLAGGFGAAAPMIKVSN